MVHNKKPKSLGNIASAYTIRAGKLKDIQSLSDSTAILVLGDEKEAFGVSCSMDKAEIPALKNIKIGESMRIKGECTGFLLDVNHFPFS